MFCDFVFSRSDFLWMVLFSLCVCVFVCVLDALLFAVLQDALNHIDAIEDISMIASKQAGLERALDTMRKEWLTQKFKLLTHKVMF